MGCHIYLELPPWCISYTTNSSTIPTSDGTKCQMSRQILPNEHMTVSKIPSCHRFASEHFRTVKKKKITIIGFLLFFPCFHCCSHSFDFNGKCLVFYIYIYLHAPKLQFRVIRFMGMFMRLVASLIFFELLHGGRILISR